MPLQSESKVTLLGCWPFEIFGSKIAEFEALVKIIKTASFFRCMQIVKSKQRIEITHFATSLVNGEYNLVGFIPRSQFYLPNHSFKFSLLICIN